MAIPHELLKARVEDLERRLDEMAQQLADIKELLVEKPTEEPS